MKPKTNLLVNMGRFPFNKNFGNSTCPADPIDPSHRACNYCFFVHVSRYSGAVLGTTILSNTKEHFGPTGPVKVDHLQDAWFQIFRSDPAGMVRSTWFSRNFWAEWRASIVCREIMAWNTYSLRTAGFLRLIIACFAVIQLNTSPVLITELEEDTKKLSLSNTQTEISLLK